MLYVLYNKNRERKLVTLDKKLQYTHAKKSELGWNHSSERMVKRLCKKYGFQYQIGKNIIFIQTETGTWYIEQKEDSLELRHKNPRYANGKMSGTMREEYHLQNIKCTDVEGYIRYIYGHDCEYLMGRQESENEYSGRDFSLKPDFGSNRSGMRFHPFRQCSNTL